MCDYTTQSPTRIRLLLAQKNFIDKEDEKEYEEGYLSTLSFRSMSNQKLKLS